MASTPFTFDAAAVLTVAADIDSAAAAIGMPAEPPVPADRFAATTSTVAGTEFARTQISDLTTALVALASQIRTAAGQFGEAEAGSSARLELS